MTVTIENTTGLDLVDIVNRSTEPDKVEALIVLQIYLRNSATSYCGKVDGIVACVWGLVIPTLLSDNAHIWLITTDTIVEHKFLFIRHSQLFMKKIRERFPVITGHVVMKQETSVRWLRWLGVEFREPILGFRKDTIFLPFIFRNS